MKMKALAAVLVFSALLTGKRCPFISQLLKTCCFCAPVAQGVLPFSSFEDFFDSLLSFCLKTSTEEANQFVCKCIRLNVSNRTKVTVDSIDER